MKSRVHPKYKTKYRVRNWASYERALIGRGNITIWLSRAASAAWKPEGPRTRGAPPKYSDLAIETALTLRLLFHLPLRQAEGFLTSLFHLMGRDLRSPDHTTLSRRGQHLTLTRRRVPRRAALHLVIDSTGLSLVGAGEWAAAKHGRRGRRGWKTRHLGVDHAGVIVAQALTDSAVDDASTGIDLIETIASSARTVTADAAYDTLAFYETANTRGTTVVVPPAKTATLSRRNPRSSARDGTIRRISKIGRRRWKKEVGYHRQARVEHAFFRYTSILGDRLRRLDSRSASCRIGACVQRAQSNDRAWSTRVVRDRSVTNLRRGSARGQFRFTQQRRIAAMTAPADQRVLAGVSFARQRRHLLVEQLLHVHQAQGDQGPDELYLGVELQVGVVLAADDLDRTPACDPSCAS